MNGRDKKILQQIVKYCDEVIATNEHFHNDEALFKDAERGFLYRNAVSMPLLQIGELSKILSDEFVSAHTGIPWRMMARMRDVLAHHYGGVDMNTTFSTATTDVPEVRKQVLRILEDMDAQQGENEL